MVRQKWHQRRINNFSDGQIKQDLAMQHHQLRKFKLYKLFVVTPLSMSVRHGTCWQTHTKRSRLLEAKYFGKLLRICFLEHKTNDCVQSKIIYLVGPQEPHLVNINSGKLSWLGHVTASPKSSFSALCRVGGAAVGRGNARRTTSKGERPRP